MFSRIFRGILVCSLIVIVGCTEQQPPVNGQDSAEDCLRKLLTSQYQGNKAVYVECFMLKDKASAGKFFEIIHRYHVLTTKIEDKYGSRVWDKKPCRTIYGVMSRTFGNDSPIEDIVKTLEVNGRHASFHDIDRSAMNLVKVGPSWYFDTEDLDLDAMNEFLGGEVAVRVLDFCIEILDQEDISYEKFYLIFNMKFSQEEETYDDYKEAMLGSYLPEFVEELEGIIERYENK